MTNLRRVFGFNALVLEKLIVSRAIKEWDLEDAEGPRYVDIPNLGRWRLPPGVEPEDVYKP